MLAVLLIIGLIAGAAPSASAAENQFLDILDYSTLNDSGSNSGNSSMALKYKLPYKTDVYSVDILVSIVPEESAPSGARIETYNDSMPLTMYHIDGYLYRLYGHISTSPFWDVTEFELTFDDKTDFGIEFLSFRISSVNHNIIGDYGTVELNGSAVTMPGVNRPAEVTNSLVGNFDAYLYFNDWRKYDQVQFTVGIMCKELHTVSAVIGDVNVPVDFSYFVIGDNSSMIYMQITADVSGIDRSFSGRLSVSIDGASPNSVMSIKLTSVNGIVFVDPPSPLVYWFTSLFTKLGNWFDGVVDTVSAGFNNVKNWLSSGFQSVVDKLDVLVNGGDGGDDLVSGGEQLKEDTGSLKDNVGSIQDFEDQYFGDLDAGMGEVISGSSISMLVGPLSFIHSYVNKIVSGVPKAYLVVFTLPMLLGIFMYIVGHPVRAPRPDTSGDQVTRETFTTTTVLSGKNAGSSTTTRTVTTSQEIGRVHNE